ncbi:MAG TPA: methionine--tRNA ligase [archaeon]|nr:methionine--tRNA ligase [archaeon]
MSKLNAKSKSKAVKKRTPNSKTFYVTTPIYYVNDVPHIGHAYTTIAADVIARYHRLRGQKVFFLTGTDEHGQKIAEAARAAGLQPKEFCDKIAPRFAEAWKKLNLTPDFFIRTTDPRHEKIVAEIIEKIYKAGYIYKGKYEGLYCVGCERFYAPNEVANDKCPLHPNKPLTKSSEENYFFKLSGFQKILLAAIENPKDKNHYDILPQQRRHEILNRIRGGLEDVSISRSEISWGIPIPWDKKQTIYVWFDALLNYYSALQFNGKKEFWENQAELMGKDILWFHSVIWPAMLIAAKIKPPTQIFAHGFWTVDGQKMSKSLGNVVDPFAMAEKYGVDALRFYLFREVSFGQDGDFSEARLKEKINSDLADGLGNLLNRSLVLCEKYFSVVVPEKAFDKEIAGAAEALVSEYEKDLESFNFHATLDKIWAFIFSLNKYINDTKPWEIKDKKKLSEVIYTLLESLRIISVLTYPFIPETSEKIFAQLGLDKSEISFSTLNKFGFLKSKNKIARGEILFKKIENKEVKSIGKNSEEFLRARENQKFSPIPGIVGKENPTTKNISAPVPASAKTSNLVPYSDFSKLDLRVAEIMSAEEVAGSDKLLKLQISVGGEKKQIVAGIKISYSPAKLVGKQIIVINNLEPREFKAVGLTSYGMLLAADSESGPILLTVDKKAKAGAKIK